MIKRSLTIHSATLILLASVVLFPSCSQTHPNHAQPVIAKLGLKKLHQPRPFILTSGQPTKEQLTTLSKEGIKHIVNLRPASELEWDEAKHVRSLGMNYISIPVDGAEGITRENTARFDRAIRLIGKEPALVHCASANRVGALAAMRASIHQGQSDREAIKTGKHWGLKSLKPDVRKKLATSR